MEREYQYDVGVVVQYLTTQVAEQAATIAQLRAVIDKLSEGAANE